jgi:hypothetical protein
MEYAVETLLIESLQSGNKAYEPDCNPTYLMPGLCILLPPESFA